MMYNLRTHSYICDRILCRIESKLYHFAKDVSLCYLLALQGGCIVEVLAYSYFTSNDAMEDLFDLEMALVRGVEKYIHDQQNILTLLSGRYEKAALTLSNILSREAYVGNPINAFSLVRRLNTEWPHTLSLINQDLLGNISLPAAEELEGAARALTRLQDIYRITTASLAQGMLPGTHGRALLTAADCVRVAQQYSSRHDYDMASEWLLQALEKVKRDQSCPLGLVLENLLIATCFQGDQMLSNEYLQQLLDRHPRYVPPDFLVHDYNIVLRSRCRQEAKQRNKQLSVPDMYQDEAAEYETVCSALPPKFTGLFCHLVHYQRPHLRFQPFKVEELHLEPPVLMFHEAMSDSEIQHFKRAAFPLMRRAEVLLPNLTSDAVLYRTSHTAWLGDEDPVSRRVSARVAAMTDLDITHAEPNQVSNYGMAGEYIIHLDAFEDIKNVTYDDYHSHYPGNRLATFMVYMSDVLLGGHTVFADLQLSVKPRKGSALFWFNQLHDGAIDYRMRHASCPVIVGNKWVMNKWLNEAGQEFRRNPPCLLHLNDTRQHYYLRT